MRYVINFFFVSEERTQQMASNQNYASIRQVHPG